VGVKKIAGKYSERRAEEELLALAESPDAVQINHISPPKEKLRNHLPTGRRCRRTVTVSDSTKTMMMEKGTYLSCR